MEMIKMPSERTVRVLMKVIQINSVYGVGSTGRIAMDLQNYLNEHGIVTKTIYGYGDGKNVNTYKMQSFLELKANIALGRFTGHHGNYNYFPTIKALQYMEKEKPDVIHLHNIHGYYINVPLLFNYIKTYKIPIVWTFHDCWPFTGHCCYFDDYNCGRWEKGCGNCPAWGDEYSIILGDRSTKNWKEKKKLFTGLEKCIIVSPSQWLADFIPYSFLNRYPVRIIHNGIDTSVFKPSNNEVKKILNIENKKMILGIAPDLNGPKGGRFMVELAKKLDDDYVIVILSLVTNEKLPGNVYVLPRTEKTMDLAKIYSAADVFINPTIHDNFPTVNLEATACGTPVITFNTGGSAEGVRQDLGEVVERENIDALTQAVIKWADYKAKNPMRIKNMKYLDKSSFAKKYVEIYSEIQGKK